MKYKSFEDLVGETITHVEGEEGDEEFTLYLKGGAKARMYHSWDCCESVTLYDIAGDVNDLLGTPITLAEEAESDASDHEDAYDDSATWTFYKLATVKGYVTFRWLGVSNGYYSETACFDWTDAP